MTTNRRLGSSNVKRVDLKDSNCSWWLPHYRSSRFGTVDIEIVSLSSTPANQVPASKPPQLGHCDQSLGQSRADQIRDRDQTNVQRQVHNSRPECLMFRRLVEYVRVYRLLKPASIQTARFSSWRKSAPRIRLFPVLATPLICAVPFLGPDIDHYEFVFLLI